MPSLPSVGLIKFGALGAGVGYLGLMLFAVLFAEKLTFPAPPPGYSDSNELLKFPYNENGDRVTMLFLKNPGSRFLVFYQHGNAEDLNSILPRLQALKRSGFSVLAWDYPGYGTSDGEPSEALILEIAGMIWKSIPETFDYPHDRVILYGRSLGGGPATWLASRENAAGLILEGTFTSIFRVGLPVNILPWDIFDNLGWIERVRCPVLFLHGTSDGTVPFNHSRRLYERAPDPKFFSWFSGGGHNDLIDAYPEIYYSSIERFGEFLSTHGQR